MDMHIKQTQTVINSFRITSLSSVRHVAIHILKCPSFFSLTFFSSHFRHILKKLRDVASTITVNFFQQGNILKDNYRMQANGSFYFSPDDTIIPNFLYVCNIFFKNAFQLNRKRKKMKENFSGIFTHSNQSTTVNQTLKA